MTGLGDLIVRVGANISDFKSAMGDVSKEINKTVTSSSRAFSGFDRLGDVFKNVGMQMTAGITLPVAAAGAAAFKFASDFDGAMRQVTSLIGNVSQQDFKQLSDATLDLSRRMGVDAVDSAHALYEALSANVPKENVMSFLEVATGTAIAGVTTTKVAVDGLTTVINSYGMSAKDAGSVSDAMFTAVNFGKVTFEELASSVGIAASAANNMGISADDLLATMAAITLQGRSSSEAFTEMQSAIKALQSPNEKMNDLLEKTGYHTGQALIEAKGFAGGLQALNTAAQGNSAALTDAFGRIEGYNAMLHVTGPAADIVSKSLGLMSDKLGATARAQAEIEQSAPRMWEKFKSQLEAVAITAGQSLLPAFSSILNIMTPLVVALAGAVRWFGELPIHVQQLALGFVATVAAAGPLVFITGQLLGTFADLAKGITVASELLVKFPAVMSAVTSVIGLAGPIAIAFGVAIAGWAIYEAITKLQSLRAEFDKLSSMQERGVKATQAQAEEIRKITDAVEQYNKQVAVAGGKEINLPDFSAFANAVDPMKEYIAALKVAAGEMPKMKTGIDGVKVSADGMVVTFGKTKTELAALNKNQQSYQQSLEAQKKAQEALNKALSGAKSNLSTVEALWKSGRVSIEAVRVATEAEKKAQDAVNESFLKAHPAYNKVADASERVMRTSAGTMRALLDLHPEMVQSAMDATELAGLMDLLSDTMEVSSGVADDFGLSLQNMKAPAYEARDAMREMGITSSAAMKDSAAAAKSAYETIKGDSNSTAGEVESAWRKMTEANIAYQRSLGNNAVADALQKQLDAHVGHGKAVSETWEKTIKQVSTAFTDFSKGIVDDIFSGNFSITKSIGDLGKALSRVFVEEAVDYVNTFVEKGIKYLMKHLDDLLDKIPGIGSALGGIFGTGASTATSGAGGAVGAAGGIGSAGGSVGSAGGSAGAFGMSSATTAAVGMVTGIVSAVSGIIGNFQNAKMETTLNHIEEGTRYSALFLGGRSDGGILGVLFRVLEEVSFGTSNKAILSLNDYVNNTMNTHLKSIADSAYWTLQKSSEISQNTYWSLRKLEDLNAAAKGPPLTINVTGYVGDRDALIAEIKRQFGSALALQGT